jgi:hypothetical protein
MSAPTRRATAARCSRPRAVCSSATAPRTCRWRRSRPRRGPAPLGPGAPPYERLCAFGRAYLDFLERHGDLILAAEFGAPGIRLAHPVYAFYRTHVTVVLGDADLGEPADYLADVLLAPLSASMFRYHRDVRGLSVEALGDAYADLCRRVLDSGG